MLCADDVPQVREAARTAERVLRARGRLLAVVGQRSRRRRGHHEQQRVLRLVLVCRGTVCRDRRDRGEHEHRNEDLPTPDEDLQRVEEVHVASVPFRFGGAATVSRTKYPLFRPLAGWAARAAATTERSTAPSAEPLTSLDISPVSTRVRVP